LMSYFQVENNNPYTPSATTLGYQYEKGPVRWLMRVLNVLAASVLFGLVLITCVDVVGRYVFNHPLTGSTEMTEIALAIVVFSVFPIISWRGEHVVVDIFDRFVPPWLVFVRSLTINITVSVGLFFIGQRVILLGNRSLGYGEVTEYLSVPTGWVINFIGGLCWITAFFMLTLGCFRAWKAYQFSKL